MNDTVWKDPALARTYLEGVRGAIPLAAEQIDVMLRLVAAADISVGRVLDLGCGDGVLGAAIADAYPHAEICYVDFSEAMIEAAREKRKQPGRSDHFVLADYGETGWTARNKIQGPFDVIVSGFSIHHQPDSRKQTLYAEIFELLQPGGIFINLEHVASSTPWVSALFDERMIDSIHAFERGANGTRSRDEVAQVYYHRDDKQANILAPVETQCEWLRGIGFVDVDCHFRLFELALFSGRKPRGL